MSTFRDYPIIKVFFLQNSDLRIINIVGKETGLPWWLSGKESSCNVGDSGSIPGSGRSPGEGYGNPLQYSCLEHAEEPDRLQSMGLQIVRRDLVTKHQQQPPLISTQFLLHPPSSLAVVLLN